MSDKYHFSATPLNIVFALAILSSLSSVYLKTYTSFEVQIIFWDANHLAFFSKKSFKGDSSSKFSHLLQMHFIYY